MCLFMQCQLLIMVLDLKMLTRWLIQQNVQNDLDGRPLFASHFWPADFSITNLNQAVCLPKGTNVFFYT